MNFRRNERFREGRCGEGDEGRCPQEFCAHEVGIRTPKEGAGASWKRAEIRPETCSKAHPSMKWMLPVYVWIALAVGLGARGDVIEFQNGAKSEGRVFALFNQRFEFADKDGSVTHVKLQQVKRISFDSRIVAVTMRDR